MPTARKQRASAHDRNAFLEAYDYQCVYCSRTIDYSSLEIDHIVPESLWADPEQLARVKANHGLPAGFDLHADYNRVAACGRCNSAKKAGILPYGLLIILTTAKEKAIKVAEFRRKSKNRKASAKWISQSSALIANDPSVIPMLHQILEENGAAIENEVDPPRDHPGLAHEWPQQDIICTFGVASLGLLNWPTETAGRWLARPEMQALLDNIQQKPRSCTVLLGGPGAGKSALLAKMASALQDEKVAFLALKADLLPRDVDSLRTLASDLGLPCEIDAGIRQLAQDYPVVLLLDQVDALGELMDQHPARLDLICRLVNGLKDVDNVHIILSCRSFEFRHDLRFSGIRHEEPVNLENPSWESVQAVLSVAGISADGWPQDAKEVLRVPQHLAMFIAHFAADGGTRHFKNYHAMIEAVLWRRVYSQPWGRTASAALDRIATELAETEELWLPASRFVPTFLVELDQLVSAGILVYTEDKFRIGFQHQTVFDYCRARAFTSGVADLVAYVLERQDALFLRPTLWSALRFMREADAVGFQRQFEALWMEKLRPHIRFLLVEFLGQVDMPGEYEARYLGEIMAEPTLRVKALIAMDGHLAWLEKLLPHVSALMVGDEAAIRHAAGYLKSAIQIAPNAVLGLLETHWQGLHARDPQTIWVLLGLDGWDERSVKLAEKVLRRPVEQTDWGRHLAVEAAKTAPELAPRLVVANLWGSLEFAESRPLSVPPPPGPDATEVEMVSYQLRNYDVDYRGVKSIVDDTLGWHDLPKVAESAPESFVRNVWSWIAHVAAKYSRVEGARSSAYATDYIFDLDAVSVHPNPFMTAVKTALQLMAQNAPRSFLAHAEANKLLEQTTIHNLLAYGYIHLCREHSNEGILYLLDDRRRFALRQRFDGDIARDLIAAATPAASAEVTAMLETAIVTWNKYSPLIEDDADTRREILKWNREARLTLLTAFPEGSLTAQGQRLVEQEKRAFPHHRDRTVEDCEMAWIGSPMTAVEMSRASDEAIIRFLNEIHDHTGTSHPDPHRAMEGGGVQAARAFGEFAKENSQRALGILPKLDPAKHQRAAGISIRSIADTATFSSEKLLEVIHESDARGFDSEEFRHEVAFALEKLSGKAKGLPPRTCRLLESWLKDESVTDELASEDHSTRSEPRSILLDRWGQLLPDGNYPILTALFFGYMQRDPAAVDGWLSVVERHLHRQERPRVWRALAGHHLKFLRNADRKRTIAVVERLFDGVPGFLESNAGLHLLADIHWWLPQETIDRCYARLLVSDWNGRLQAVAELATLRYCLVPSDSRAAILVEVFLQGEGGTAVSPESRLGVAYIAAELWNHPPARTSATRALLDLLPIESQAEAHAWLRVFRFQQLPPADIYTQQLLDALATQDGILRNPHLGFLIDQLKGLLEQGREHIRVCKIITRLVAEAGDEFGDIRTSWAASAGDLVDIALTLQRFTETREGGLRVFERLMAADAYKLSDALRLLDRRFPG